MLVLTRKKDQSIMIGDDIEIKVVAVDGDQVKIGIEAPRHIDVHREEIYDAIRQANNQAVAKETPSLLKNLLKKLTK